MKKNIFLVSMLLAASTLLCACGADKETEKGKDQAEETLAEQEADKDSEDAPAKRNSISAGIDETTTSKYGECGPDLMWYLQEMDGILVIRGTGNMSFSTYETPWYQYEEDIHRLVIEDGCTSIAKEAFAGCPLESAVIPDTVTAIGEAAFKQCGLKSLAIPDSVTEIGKEALKWSALEEIEIPKGITEIAYGTFSGNSNLRSVTIPDTVTSIGGDAFNGCSSLESVTIPGSVTSIGDSAFLFCTNLKTVTLQEGVTSIGNAFEECDSLESITIPKSVNSIGNDVFMYCENLENIVIENKDIEFYNGDMMDSIQSDAKIIIAGEEQ